MRTLAQPTEVEGDLPSDDGDWIARHQVMVWRFLRYLGAAADVAEDLAQEVFVAAIRHGVVDAERSAAGPWLRATARNVWLDRLRRERRRLPTASLEDVEAEWLAAAGDDGGERRKRALERCLKELDGRAREAVERRYALQQSRAEMAAALELSEAGVKGLLRRVRAALGDCIARQLENDHD